MPITSLSGLKRSIEPLIQNNEGSVSEDVGESRGGADRGEGERDGEGRGSGAAPASKRTAMEISIAQAPRRSVAMRVQRRYSPAPSDRQRTKYGDITHAIFEIH